MTSSVGVEGQCEVGWKDTKESLRTRDIYRRITLWAGDKCRSWQESLLVDRETGLRVLGDATFVKEWHRSKTIHL